MTYGTLFWAGGDQSGFLGTDPAALSYAAYPADMVAAAATLPPSSREIRIGVIDSGVNPHHPQIAPYLAEARAFAGEDAEDRLGHGTAVAILALGPRPGENHRLFSARVTDAMHRPVLDAVIAAITWLAESKVDTINISLGFTAGPETERLCDALHALAMQEDSPLVVVAAGNLGPDVSPVPAACTAGNILVVASDEASSGRGDLVSPRGLFVSAAEFHYRRGLDLASAGQPDAALEAFGQAAATDPTDARPLFGRAVLLFQFSRNPEAEADLEAVLERAPDFAEALWLGALLRGNADDRAGTLAYLKRLLAVDPEHEHGRTFQAALAADANAGPRSILQKTFGGD